MGVVFLPQNKQEALHKFIEIHFSPDNEYTGNILVMVTGKGKTTPHLVGAFAANEEAPAKICNIIKSKSCGYYITANTFKGAKRNSSEVFQLKNIVIDIDMHQKRGSSFNQIREDGINSLSDAIAGGLLESIDIPTPNTIINTGRGVQLWYRIDDMGYKMDWMYKYVAEEMRTQIQEIIRNIPVYGKYYEVDKKASGSIAGLYRFPGTFNSKAGRYGKIRLMHDSPYSLESLYKNFKKEEAYLGNKNTVAAKEHSKKTFKNPENIAEFRNKALSSLIRIRQKEDSMSTYGSRDLFLYCMCCSLNGIEDEEKTINVLRNMNKMFSCPMPEREWQQYMSTAIRKKHYIKNSTIIEYLNITKEEQDLIGLYPESKNRSSSRTNKKDKENRDKKILNLCREGKNKSEIAKEIGCSIQTITRILEKSKTSTSAEKRRADAISSAIKGATAETIASVYGYCKSMARRIVQNAKAILSKQASIKKEIEKRVKDIYDKKEDMTKSLNALIMSIEEKFDVNKAIQVFISKKNNVEQDIYNFLLQTLQISKTAQYNLDYNTA